MLEITLLMCVYYDKDLASTAQFHRRNVPRYIIVVSLQKSWYNFALFNIASNVFQKKLLK